MNHQSHFANWPDVIREPTKKNALKFPVPFLERLCLAPLVAAQYPCPCLCSPIESFTASQSATCYLSAQRNKSYTRAVCSQQINMPSVGKIQRVSEWQGYTVEDTERTESLPACTHPTSICQYLHRTVILPLIVSVFYHDALLSPTRSWGSCQRSPLSASHRVWQRKTGQCLPTDQPPPPTHQPAAPLDRRQPERGMGFLLT